LNSQRLRLSAIVSVLVLAAAALSACTAASPTAVYVYATPAPATGTPLETDTPTANDTSVETDTATPEPTPTVTGTPSASLSASPTPIGAGCSGSADNQAWFVGEAKHLTKFTMYCGHLPSGWHLSSANDNYNKGGWLVVTYSGPSGAKLTLQEGAYCLTSASACAPSASDIGPSNFADLNGELYGLSGGSGYAVYVNPGTSQAYAATGTKVSQAALVSIANALVKVPRS
jgi:hypothetical protein